MRFQKYDFFMQLLQKLVGPIGQLQEKSPIFKTKW